MGVYARYALAGALCCALTHGAVVPIDVVKTRMQLEPGVYVKGMLATAVHLVREEGTLRVCAWHMLGVRMQLNPSVYVKGFWLPLRSWSMQRVCFRTRRACAAASGP